MEQEKQIKKMTKIGKAAIFIGIIIFLAVSVEWHKNNELKKLFGRWSGDKYAAIPENNVFIQGRILGEEDGLNISFQGESFSSEDFSLEQLTVGGDLSVELSNVDQNLPLEIYDTKSQLVVDKEDKETKMLLSFRTNKPSWSTIEYSKNGENITKKIEGDGYSYSQSIIIPALDPSSVYNYTISVEDNQGNKKASEKFVFYTGAPDVSLVEMLEDAVEKSFGWAVKR